MYLLDEQNQFTMKPNFIAVIALLFAGLFMQAQSTMVFERIEPEFTTVDRLIELKAGMTKEEVLATLEVYPYDILYNQENQCEIHIVKYAKTKRRHMARKDKPGTEEQLSDGTPYYSGMDEVAIYYRDGALEAFIVESLEKSTYELLNYDAFLAEQCNPESPAMPPIVIAPTPPPPAVLGCTDSLSITFNPKATEDDGSCEYCQCGYVRASYDTRAEELTCPPCLPSAELWQYWIVMDRCDLIQAWIEKYPPLLNNVPEGFLEECKPKALVVVEEEDCDWCRLIEESNIKVELHEIDVKLKNGAQ